MTSRGGASPAGAADPLAAIIAGIVSWSKLPGNSQLPVADAARLAAHICAQVEHGGYPLTCLANGHIDLASPGSEEALDEALAAMDLLDKTLARVLMVRRIMGDCLDTFDAALQPAIDARPHLARIQAESDALGEAGQGGEA